MSTTGLPLNFDSSGPVASTPQAILAAYLALVETYAPGYTANLPGALVEDLSSTGLGGIITIDQARVDSVNNVSPYSANAYVLTLQGYALGLPQGTPTNGQVDVVFSGTPGFAIPAGWVITDGTNQYAVAAPGTIVGSGGTAPQCTAIATNSNVFAIPAGSVNQLVTQPPVGVALSVTNPQDGIEAQSAETTQAFRARILDGQKVAISGANTYLKTLVKAVPGVVPRLVSVIQNGEKWTVVAGGGDVYAVGYAIYQGVSSIGLLAGSSIDSGRNVNVSIYDAPDTYNVVFVNPPAQVVTVAVVWNTTLPNFTSGAAVNQYIIQAVQAYINGITVGQPINLLELNQTIQGAVTPVLDPINLTTLQYVVTINGVEQGPTAGTSIIPSDPESYFSISPSGATSVQG